MSEITDDDGTFEEQRERVDEPMRRLFATYGRRDWSALVLGLLAGVGAHAFGVVPPYLLGVALDSVFEDSGRAFTLPLVPDAWLPTAPADQFWLIAGLVAASYLLAAVCAWVMGFGLNAFAQRVQHKVRTDTYDAMQSLDLGFFSDKQTGELMSILNNDVNRLEQFLNGGLNMATRITFIIVSTGGVLLYVNWQLALVTMGVVPVIAVFTHYFVQAIQPKYAEVRSTVGTMNSRLENNLGGIAVIKASTAEAHESEQVEDASREYFDTNWEAITTRIKFFPGLQLTAGIGFVVTFVVGGLWVFSGPPLFLTGTLSVGEFVTFIMLSQRFVWPLAQFGQLINLYQRAYASSERVFGLMDEPGHLDVDEDAPDLTVTDGRVEYDGVTFAYDEDDDAEEDHADPEPVVEDLNFTVEGGEMLALVGPTGAGKSTALKLLMRLYDVGEGAIRVDGQDVREVSLPSLRRTVGYVGQETFLFYGSVADNVRYGAFDADREDVIEAAKMAEAHEFVTDLEDGYDTEVGERGVKLSGGQRQRIAIARVLLQDPEILVLDEATSDVDTETEVRIQESIETLVEDRTVLAIAHRLSTIKDADQILVVEDGEITERGTHDELLAAEGTYADLWGVQAGRLEDLPEGTATAD
ncbi:multidrug ABC transporter ATP-binding protein [Halobacteriales archaeon QS_8_69_26]|nr:MAG: multidrug ABC transporter ATP-binding protein [Halobacteriales archaeon QS_8_69_26]